MKSAKKGRVLFGKTGGYFSRWAISIGREAGCIEITPRLSANQNTRFGTRGRFLRVCRCQRSEGGRVGSAAPTPVHAADAGMLTRGRRATDHLIARPLRTARWYFFLLHGGRMASPCHSRTMEETSPRAAGFIIFYSTQYNIFFLLQLLTKYVHTREVPAVAVTGKVRI